MNQSASEERLAEHERKRAIAAIHWVFSADGTKSERSMADEAINKINDPTFMPSPAPADSGAVAVSFDGFAADLRAAMTQRGVTVRDFAPIIGVDKSAVSRAIRGLSVSAENFVALWNWLHPASPSMGSVTVKALKWTHIPSLDVWSANGGMYWAWQRNGVGYWRRWHPQDNENHQVDGDQEVAEAAAQQDYEARILSALNLPPDHGGGEGRMPHSGMTASEAAAFIDRKEGELDSLPQESKDGR